MIAAQLAAQLAARRRPGVVLCNGEFGERLVDHAERAGLRFSAVRLPLGAAWTSSALQNALALHPEASWCWMVHHETSTGVLNDLDAAGELCRDRGIALCADCVSSIGVVPVRLRHVHLASGVSGKGLASVAGLALVFHDGDLRVGVGSRYLDLSLYAAAKGVPFTHSSGQLRALRVGVERALGRADFAELRALASWTRTRLRSTTGFRSRS